MTQFLKHKKFWVFPPIKLWVLYLIILGGLLTYDIKAPLKNTVAVVPKKQPTISPLATITSQPIVLKRVESIKKSAPKPSGISIKEWGKAYQIGESTWTMQVGQDNRMATPREIFDALNVYRQRNGKSSLSWDDKLSSYAQSRTDGFSKAGNIDAHAGFNDYLNNQDGFRKLAFYEVGENSSFGYKMLGVHLIEWIYAGDEPHNLNQLSSKWSHVGIGVTGTATDLIFGGQKM